MEVRGVRMNVWEVGREEDSGLLTFGMDSARRHPSSKTKIFCIYAFFSFRSGCMIFRLRISVAVQNNHPLTRFGDLLPFVLSRIFAHRYHEVAPLQLKNQFSSQYHYGWIFSCSLLNLEIVVRRLHLHRHSPSFTL